MGQGPEIPKLFRLGGKVRNKHIAKRDTEKLVKEIWKERMNDPGEVLWDQRQSGQPRGQLKTPLSVAQLRMLERLEIL